ncbi:hypothetical protein ABEB36_007187 [Hypothenemus hampei]|uniref:Uncharacterized protein n=2 Tax=Hypothenemus hampei TaxID=57062 RepID=A0ABD1EX28_HYPHA
MAADDRNDLLKNIPNKTVLPKSAHTGNQVRCSLPCNVNSGETSREFLEEAKRNKEMREKEFTTGDMEKERLIEHDLLARGFEERLIDGGGSSNRGGPVSNPVETHVVTTTPKYTSKATLHIQSNRASVDDPIPLAELDAAATTDKKIDTKTLAKMVQHSQYQILIPHYKGNSAEEKLGYFQKVDENGNALGNGNAQTKEKKKKKQSDKNVVVLKSENIEGHKSEIIHNVDRLVQFIEGTTENNNSGNVKSRQVQQSKSKQLHKQHTAEEGGTKSKKRHLKSGKDNGGDNIGGELKKSNSLGEISGMKLDREFETFKNKREKEDENVVLRGNKPGLDRTRERRSWGTMEPPSPTHHSLQALYNASSLENLEMSTDNWEVTRPKKKSKKRRNSVSSASGARQNSSAGGLSSSGCNDDRRGHRALSPDLRVAIVGVSNVKTTRSMPHSEKSNDSSSDVDSVHSLPMDGPISYADIAKNSEKKKPSPEKQQERSSSKEKSPQPLNVPKSLIPEDPKTTVVSISQQTTNSPELKSPPASVSNKLPPDVHNFKSFPAITGSITAKSPPSSSTSDKAVQSMLSYVETCSPTATAENFAQKSDNSNAIDVPVVGKRPATTTTNNNLSKEKRNIGNNNCKESLSRATASVQGFFANQQHGEVSELSLMKDPAQYAVQRMPPDIMDVSTIEKMHFMTYSPSSPPHATTSTPTLVDLGGGKTRRKKGGNNNSNSYNNNNNSSSSGSGSSATSVCDTTSSLEATKLVNGVSDEASYSSPEPYQQSLQQHQNQINSSGSPPPVVILSSGAVPKEVPSGLIFGFDINEQLLLEDSIGRATVPQRPINEHERKVVTENNVTIPEKLPFRGDDWSKKFKAPMYNLSPKHNHDKIVNFISTAWEYALSNSVQYYTDEL